jgi:hypothetical protein
MRKNIAFFLAAILVLMAAFIFVERAFAPSFQKCIAEHPQSDSNSAAEKNPTRFYVAVSTYVRCSGRFIESHNGAFTALSTFIIAAFTGTLWIATTRQAELTKEALIEDKRAFIFTNSLNGFWEQDPSTGLYNWRFRALWQNSGDTPTRHMVMHVACELRNAMLPPGFNFNYPTTQTGDSNAGTKVEQLWRNRSHVSSSGHHPSGYSGRATGKKISLFVGLGEIFRRLSRHAATHH